MTSVFKNLLTANIGTTPTTVLTSNSTATTTIIGMSATNTTSEMITLTIRITDPNGGGLGVATSAIYLSNAIIPAYQSLRVINGGEKLILGPSNALTMTASVNSSCDLVMSWVEIS